MSTVTLHPRAIVPAATPSNTSSRLPPFWSSLNQRQSAAGAEPAPQAVRSPALVGDLWIQIR